MIANDLGCELKSLPIYTTSINFLVNEKTIIKYLGSIEMPKEKKVFKVTYRDKTSKIASFTEIYDLQKVLLKRVDLN